MINNEVAESTVATPAAKSAYKSAKNYHSGSSTYTQGKTIAGIDPAYLTHCRDVFCIIDESLNCTYLSANCEAVLGLKIDDGLLHGMSDHIAPDHKDKVKNYLIKGETQNSVLFQIKHTDGKWHWCEMQLIEAKENNKSDLQYKCLLRNVTDVITAKHKLEKANLEADLANKSRSEFLANMSHELRTPLNAILGFAQMIENGTYGLVENAKYTDYIGNIQESGLTLLSKVNDLLEIANVDSGRMILNESTTDIVDIIRSAIEHHSHKAFSNRIKIRDSLPQEPLLVVVDRVRMLQVITNILSNSIKHTPAEGFIDIFCKTRKDGGINIVIEDNGGGIKASHLQNILAAFRQDNSFFARSRDCVGIGLALSKEIVKLHNGKITIVSEPGNGTTLTICLPKDRTVRKAVLKNTTLNKSAPKKLEIRDECLVS